MADNYELYMTSNGVLINFTSYVNSFSWSESVDKLSIDFSATVTKDKEVDLASGIILLNNKNEVFNGIVISISENYETYSIKARDYGFYLNKQEVIKQFKNITVSDALGALYKQNNVDVYNIPNIITKVNKIFKGSISKITKDLLNMATNDNGKIYYLEMTKNKIHIYERDTLGINPYYELEDTGEQFPCNKLILNDYSKDITIENVVNSVLIYSQKKKRLNIKETKQNEDSINKYGLMQKVLKLNDKNKAETRNTANRILIENSQPKQKIKLTVLGSDEIKAGRTIYFEDETIGVASNFNILSCSHSYKNRVHKTSMNLEVI